MAKGRGGFIGQDGLNAPDSPTGVTGTAANISVSVAFTAPTDVGGAAITGYRVQAGGSSAAGQAASGSASPITVPGLTNGTAYTFNVWAINAFGYSAPSDASGSVTPALPPANAIHIYDGDNRVTGYNISSTGSAYDFGDARASNVSYSRCAANSTRILFGAHVTGKDITYMTWASGGTASTFGDDINSRYYYGALSNDTRAVWVGGAGAGSNPSGGYGIAYSTIASTGNVSDFGDIQTNNEFLQSGLSNTTRGVVAGGSSRNPAGMEYITIASTGNSTNFGNLLATGRAFGYSQGTASSGTRGLYAGGAENSQSNVIEYITIASTGNSTDFGDLTQTDNGQGSSSNKTRAVFTTGRGNRIMSYVTIASTGNATYFGSLDDSSAGSAGTSNAHGGLS